jgi:predicted DNA-binding antitoxin AbrB/MazE fold protein
MWPMIKASSGTAVQTITARFEDGVLRPMQPLDLPPNAEVSLTIELLQPPRVTVGTLNAFLQSLPKLAEDAEDFAEEVRSIRASMRPETNLWD